MSKIIKDCLTGIDGETYDPARVLLFVGGLAFILYAGYSVWNSHTFDPQSYGVGLGGLSAGGGWGIGAKSSTEPK